MTFLGFLAISIAVVTVWTCLTIAILASIVRHQKRQRAKRLEAMR